MIWRVVSTKRRRHHFSIFHGRQFEERRRRDVSKATIRTSATTEEQIDNF